MFCAHSNQDICSSSFDFAQCTQSTAPAIWHGGCGLLRSFENSRGSVSLLDRCSSTRLCTLNRVTFLRHLLQEEWLVNLLPGRGIRLPCDVSASGTDESTLAEGLPKALGAAALHVLNCGDIEVNACRGEVSESVSVRKEATQSKSIQCNAFIIEGSLEVKLPTIWRDEKQSRAEAQRRGRLEERR